MVLDPRRLLVLTAVAERGGVVAAAEALNLTPSAVSQQLVRLEREAGVALVDRSRRQARLTVAGEQLADRGRQINAELLAAEADVAQWTGATGARVTVAAFPTVIKRLLMPVIAPLAVGHQLTVRVIERDKRPALADLHAGHADLLFVEHVGSHPGDAGDAGPRRVRGATGTAVPPTVTGATAPPTPTGLRTAMVIEDAYRIAVPAEWPAVQWLDDGVIAEELGRRPWITSPRGTATFDAMERLAGAWGFAPREAHECEDLTTAIALVAAGLGAATMPQLAWADVSDRTLLVDTGAAGSAAADALGSRRILGYVRASRRRSAALELLLAAIRREAEALDVVVQHL